MTSSLTSTFQAAFEDYWQTDHTLSISRDQMKETIRKLDASCSDAELDTLFDSADRNMNGRIEYEEFIEFVFSHDQVADLAMHELDLLQLAAGTKAEEADLAKILEISKKDALGEEHVQMESDAAFKQALEASVTEDARRRALDRDVQEKAEEAERALLAASLREAEEDAERRKQAAAAADMAELEAALKASEAFAAEEAERIRKKHEEEDSSELFRAALRASCLDLGPRGISQAAKVFATGDPSLGQPKAGFNTTTSGARGRRSRSSMGAAPSYTGSEGAPAATQASETMQSEGRASPSPASRNGRTSPTPASRNGRASPTPASRNRKASPTPASRHASKRA